MYLWSKSAVTILMSIKKVVEAWILWLRGIMMLIKLVAVVAWLCLGYINWFRVSSVQVVLQVKFGGVCRAVVLVF